MKKNKLLILTKYSDSGPSSRYRYYNYKPCFERADYIVSVQSFFSSEFLTAQSFLKKALVALSAYFVRLWLILKLLMKRNAYQLVIIEYELFPYFPSIFEGLLKWRKIPYLVDYDDAIFHRYDKHINPIIKFLFKNKIAKVMSYARCVIVGNQYLMDYAKRHNDKVLLLPTVVILDKYKKVLEEFNKQNQERNKNFVIGWIGSKSTSPYILPVLENLKQIVDLYDNVVCHLIGFDQELLSEKEIKECKITVIPWSEESEIEQIINFDVGIMPLKDDSWSKGKCGFKLIQYMSCKKPVIASPVGVNKTIVENGVNGFLATSSEQWLQAFVTLYKYEALRKSMSAKSWQRVDNEYNYSINCEKYIKLINDIIENSND